MTSKVSTLALAGAAALLATGGAALAQDQDPAQQRPLNQQPGAMNAQPGQGDTLVCRFTSGPRAGSVVDFTGTPGIAPVSVGSQCADLTGSSGVAVASNQAQGATQSRTGPSYHYQSSGQLERGFTLSCRFDRGAKAGQVVDFTGKLGADPIRIGAKCSDAQGNSGVAVSPTQPATP